MGHPTLGLLVALLTLAPACGQPPRLPTVDEKAALPTAAESSALIPSPRPSPQAPSGDARGGGQPAAARSDGADQGIIEERSGPFSLAGHVITAVLGYRRLPGRGDPESRALTSLELRDATGRVWHRETFPHVVEHGAFVEMCSADVRLLSGNNGKGILIDAGCVPSAPLSGGPWQVFGVVGGGLVPFGKPLVATGELGEFVPGAVSRAGHLTRILPDVLTIRIWTGYFFVTVPVRINWLEGSLALGRRCMYQTGHGLVEEGCEMPVEDARPAPRAQPMTFVRLFREANEHGGPPAHVVVTKESRIRIVGAKVLVTPHEGPEVVELTVDEDVWVKVLIDGQDGWIHTAEDLNAIGLFASG